MADRGVVLFLSGKEHVGIHSASLVRDALYKYAQVALLAQLCHTTGIPAPAGWWRGSRVPDIGNGQIPGLSDLDRDASLWQTLTGIGTIIGL